MLKIRTTPSNGKMLQRTSAVLGLFALVLLQFSATSHQFEHHDDHIIKVCDTCTALNHIDDVSAATHTGFDCVTTSDSVTPNLFATFKALVVTPFQSRAPPLS